MSDKSDIVIQRHYFGKAYFISLALATPPFLAIVLAPNGLRPETTFYIPSLALINLATWLLLPSLVLVLPALLFGGIAFRGFRRLVSMALPLILAMILLGAQRNGYLTLLDSAEASGQVYRLAVFSTYSCGPWSAKPNNCFVPDIESGSPLYECAVLGSVCRRVANTYGGHHLSVTGGKIIVTDYESRTVAVYAP